MNCQRVPAFRVYSLGAINAKGIREACRAKSNADFVNKIQTALQELDETTYWLDLLQEIYADKRLQSQALMTEAVELISIFVTVTKSVKALHAAK